MSLNLATTTEDHSRYLLLAKYSFVMRIKLIRFAKGILSLLAIALVITALNQCMHILTRGRFLTQEDATQRFELLVNDWHSVASNVWMLPFRLILSSMVLLGGLALIVLSLRRTQPAIQVYGLVAERLFGLAYGLFLGALGVQIGAYMLAYCYAQLLLMPDPLFTGWLRSAGAALVIYLPLGLGALVVGLRAFHELLIRGGGLTAALLASYWDDLRSESGRLHLPVPLTDESTDILVVSDLHIAGPKQLTLEQSKDPQMALEFVRRAVHRTNPKLLLCCGDITDTGDKRAWERLRSFLQELPCKFVAVPGNHDYHFRLMTREHRGAWLSFKELFGAEALLSPSSHAGDTVLRNLNDVSARSISQLPFLLSSDQIEVDILLLDSNMRASSSPITNAIGRLGEPQLREARRLLSLRDHPQRLLLVMVHHHIAPPKAVGRSARLFLRCLDTHALWELTKAHEPAVIIHGTCICHTYWPVSLSYFPAGLPCSSPKAQ